MRVIAKKALREYWEANPRAEQPLRAWHKETEKAVWNTPQDVKDTYGSASIIHGDRVVFNIAGNRYRLVVKVVYRHDAVFVRFIGTHGEYDKIDAESV